MTLVALWIVFVNAAAVPWLVPYAVLTAMGNRMNRKPLPQRRHAESFDIKFGGQNALHRVTCGYYDHDGQELGEVFIAGSKVGSDVEAMGRDVAILMSLCLQHGCSMQTMRDALTREGNGSPSTIAGAVADMIVKRQQPEGEKQ